MCADINKLTALAELLETADASHAVNGEPTYDQTRFTHSCGTPACALGHWAMANPGRWGWSGRGPEPLLLNYPYFDPIPAACIEFDLPCMHAIELFGPNGCDNAKTGCQAARYIRDFIIALSTLKSAGKNLRNDTVITENF